MLPGVWLVFPGSTLRAAEEEFFQIDTFFERANRLSVPDVISLADRFPVGSDTAIALYSIATGRYRQDLDEVSKQYCVLGWMKMGDAYYRQGDYTQAFSNYGQALRVCETLIDKEHLPDIYLKIGSVYCTFLDYETGIYYYEKAYEWSKQYPGPGRDYSILINLAGACSLSGKRDDFARYYSLSRQLLQPGDTLQAYMDLLCYGLDFVNQEKYAEAVQVFHRLIPLSRKLDSRYEASSYEELYKAWFQLGNMDSSLYYIRKCLALSMPNDWDYMSIAALQACSDAYGILGDEEKSLAVKAKYLALSDSVFNMKEFNRIKHAQSIAEMREMNAVIAALQGESAKKQRMIRMQWGAIGGIAAGFLVLALLFGVVFSQKRRLEAAYRSLYGMNRESMDSEKKAKTAGNQEMEDEWDSFLSEGEGRGGNLEAVLDGSGADRLRPKEEKGIGGTESGKTLRPAKAEAAGTFSEGKGTFGEDDADKAKPGLSPVQKKTLLEAIKAVMEREEVYCDTDFNLGKLASLVNSNSKYVSQVINEHYRKNFNAYLNVYRIRTARARLADRKNYGNYTIKAIAESVGYKSNTTFVNAFKELTGMPPSVFLKMAKEEGS